MCLLTYIYYHGRVTENGPVEIPIHETPYTMGFLPVLSYTAAQHAYKIISLYNSFVNLLAIQQLSIVRHLNNRPTSEKRPHMNVVKRFDTVHNALWRPGLRQPLSTKVAYVFHSCSLRGPRTTNQRAFDIKCCPPIEPSCTLIYSPSHWYALTDRQTDKHTILLDISLKLFQNTHFKGWLKFAFNWL